MSSLENAAITGATGFIGGHLVRRLMSAGYQPALLARARKDDGLLAGFGSRIRWAQLDLTDGESAGEVLCQVKPKVLFHLAGTRGRGEPNASVACAELNVGATVRLLEAATRAGVQRVVIIGSAEEYGDQPVPFHESLPLRPTSPYGISKAAATGFARAMHAGDGCPVVILRPFTAYGPGQPADMFIADAVNAAVRNLPFKMSHGEQRRDLIFVEDVVEALIAAASAPGIEGKVINIGTGQAHRLRDVATLIWELTGTQASLLIGARNNAADQFSDTWADIALARELLGWEPKTDLITGLRITIRHAEAEIETKAEECRAA